MRPIVTKLVACVCLSVTAVSRAKKTTELIKMPFLLRSRVGPRKHVLDGVQIPPCKGTILRGKEAAYCKV